MTREKESDPLNSLANKLRHARGVSNASVPAGAQVGREVRHGLAFALRIGVELVSALVVGVIIGLALDYWLGTTPWCLLVFFVMGSVAGFFNVYKTAGGISQTVGYRDNLKISADQGSDSEETEGNRDSG